MTKEEKLVFAITLMPLLRDVMEEVSEKYPKIFTRQTKKVTNDLIKEFDKLGDRVTMDFKGKDLDEVRQQYQDIYEVHLGIANELK